LRLISDLYDLSKVNQCLFSHPFIQLQNLIERMIFTAIIFMFVERIFTETRVFVLVVEGLEVLLLSIVAKLS